MNPNAFHSYWRVTHVTTSWPIGAGVRWFNMTRQAMEQEFRYGDEGTVALGRMGFLDRRDRYRVRTHLGVPAWLA